jgi:hypothetical protein
VACAWEGQFDVANQTLQKVIFLPHRMLCPITTMLGQLHAPDGGRPHRGRTPPSIGTVDPYRHRLISTTYRPNCARTAETTGRRATRLQFAVRVRHSEDEDMSLGDLVGQTRAHVPRVAQ